MAIQEYSEAPLLSQRARGDLKPVPTFAAIALIMATLFWVTRWHSYTGDEVIHFDQIELFVHGKWEMLPNVPQIPLYHLIQAAAGSVHGSKVPAYRLFNVVLGFACCLVFWQLARQLKHQRPTLHAATQWASPLVALLYFMIYTDVLSLLLIITSLWLCNLRRWSLAGLAAGISIAVRQQNIIWIPALMTYAYLMVHGPTWNWKDIGTHVQRMWFCVLACVLFVVFVIWNHGVAVGDRKFHPSFSLHLSNLTGFLWVWCVALLPVHLANATRIKAAIHARPLLLVATLATFLIVLFTFRSDHPFYEYEGFLRHRLLNWSDRSMLHRCVIAIPAAMGFLALLSTKLQESAAIWLIPYAVLSLLPIWLVEQRYYIAIFALLLLFKTNEDRRWVEYSQLAWFAALSSLLGWVVFSNYELFV